MLEVDGPSVCAMRCEWRGNTLLALHNLSPEPCELSLPPGALGAAGTSLTEMLSDREYERRDPALGRIDLAGYGYRWLRYSASGSWPLRPGGT